MASNVNQPTHVATKEADINRKLQIYGIYSAFANGKVPSNKQIDVALNSAVSSDLLSSSTTSKLSQEGQHLVQDVKEVINQAKLLLLSKNEGNLLQDFIWQTQQIDGGNASTPNAPLSKDQAKQHGDQALQGLRTLGTLIISNGQFRKLLNDAVTLMRDVAGDAASNVADKVNPPQEKLDQMDEPAEDNQWHDTPDIGDLKSQAKHHVDRNKPFSRSDVKDAANDAANNAQRDAQQQPSAQGAASAGATTAARSAFTNLKSQASDNVPDETKDQTRQRKEDAKQAKENAKESSKQYMKKKMPEERREQTLWRLRKMVAEIQGHDDYQQAIETLISLAETYGGHAKTLAKDTKGTVDDAHAGDSNLQRAENDLKVLIERFANCTSLDDLFDSFNNIYADADRDPELKNWFKSVDKFIRRCLQEQGYILRDSSTDEYNALYDKGEFLLRDRYRDHTDRILDEFKFLADQFDQDAQNQAFGQAVQKLFLDLGQDENGKATFKPHLIKDLTNVIIPQIFENTRYVPVPRIEVSDPTIDAIVENLVIESDNLFPNVVEFESDNYFKLGRRQANSTSEHKIMIAASGIQMDLKDVAYYVKKKEGFPSLTDTGVMDVFLGGQGFSFKLAARTARPKDRTHFVAIDNVTVKVHDLKLKLKKSHYKLLFNIFNPILLKVMRPVIQKVIEKEIKSNFEKLDAFLYDIYQDAQKAAKAAADDPDNAQGIFQQYLGAYQRKVLEKKDKAAEKAKNTDVNMAMTKEDSMFKNISLPGGISTKATEYKQLAAKGDKWQSPVFSIGSASESSNIPKVGSVTRKPHSTAEGTIRGGNHPNSGPTMTNGGPNTPSSGPTMTNNSPSYQTSGGPNMPNTSAAYQTNRGPQKPYVNADPQSAANGSTYLSSQQQSIYS